MTPEERASRIEDFKLNPEEALFTTLEEFKNALDEVIPLIKEINVDALEQVVGEDGKTPERGVDYMTDDDLNIFEEFIVARIPRVGIELPSIEQMEKYVTEQVRKIPRIKGDQGEKGTPGEDGKDGKDGSADSGADIVRKLRALGRNQGLKIDDIRGLKNIVAEVNALVEEVQEMKDKWSNLRVTGMVRTEQPEEPTP